jgi:glycyl-tRNA synthetase
MNKKEDRMDAIVALCKRRGFVFQGSEIYGGLAGTWDYGPLGLALKKNIQNLWWKRFVDDRDDMFGIDSAILMHPKVWESSGHTGAGFTDPLVEDKKTKKRYRADHLLEENGIDPAGMSLEKMSDALKENKIKSPDGNELSDVRKFNMMFETKVGSIEGEDMTVYLRPETAQGMFMNYKNIMDTSHPKLPFGIAQVGRCFRNEIAPREFLFRVRELEIMELEYFIRENDWKSSFEYWIKEMHAWFDDLGFKKEDVQEIEIASADLAHYSKRTMDFYFKFPSGFKEISGIAYRTDHDLKSHSKSSGVDLSYFDEATKERFIPHIIEPTFGFGRHVFAVLQSAYSEDELGGEKRVFLRLLPKLAPYKVAIFPLLKNKPVLVDKAREIYSALKTGLAKSGIQGVVFDDNGNIGKRYRRQDEIGTPFCITIDFDTIEKGSGVTVRDRDSGKQERIAEVELLKFLKEKIGS